MLALTFAAHVAFAIVLVMLAIASVPPRTVRVRGPRVTVVPSRVVLDGLRNVTEARARVYAVPALVLPSGVSPAAVRAVVASVAPLALPYLRTAADRPSAPPMPRPLGDLLRHASADVRAAARRYEIGRDRRDLDDARAMAMVA